MHHYPFHIGDYVAHTRHLSPLEDLAYRRLLDAYYLREGPLPHDVATCARLIGLRDHEAEVGAVLVEFFEDAVEGWRSGRADEEIAAYRAKQEQASRAGRASAERRQSARSTNAEPPLNARSTDVERPLNGRATNQNQNQNQNHVPPNPPEGEDEAEVKARESRAALFAQFWAAYPRKVGKDAAWRSFERRKPDRAMLDRMLAAIAQQRLSAEWQKEGGQYIPHPTSWLNQGRWQDEVAQASLLPPHMANWPESTKAQVLKLFPDGNVPSSYVPFGVGG